MNLLITLLVYFVVLLLFNNSKSKNPIYLWIAFMVGYLSHFLDKINF